jgi:hypothetical protein
MKRAVGKRCSRKSIILHEITPSATLIHPEEPQDRAEELPEASTTHPIATRLTRRCNGLLLGPHNYEPWWMKRRFVDWRFSTEDARIKLKRLYPSLQE